jgi:peptide/nickel transport system substrate-binding protein
MRTRSLHALAAVLVVLLPNPVALGQKPGGILRVYHIDSPASMSIHEESTISAVIPMMGVFNNLVLYDQHVAQSSIDTIRPELATEWSWDNSGTALSFQLRHGVTWHDGKTFSAGEVKCTWELLTGHASDKLRLNPRASWYANIAGIDAEHDDAVTFHLKRPQPAFLALLASGLSPIYSCHVSPAEMRRHPIGTGPFKFVEFKPNERIVLARNADYWRQGRPYLDGIEYTVIRNPATANLAFIAGKFDLTFPLFMQPPAMREVKSQAPDTICELVPQNVSRNVIVNRDAPPFNKPQLRQAMALALDRKAFLDILGEGQGQLGGAMQPPPAGRWGLPIEMLQRLPGYSGEVQKNRGNAAVTMAGLGYGPTNRLSIKVSARNIPTFRDTAVLLIDQLKQIYIDGELDLIDTANWYPKIARRDYAIGINVTANCVNDPDANFYDHYSCGGTANPDGYCNRAIDNLIDQQSTAPDPRRRRELVWQIEQELAKDGARPIIFYPHGVTCHQPSVKGLTIMVNSSFNGWRFEDVWLDR